MADSRKKPGDLHQGRDLGPAEADLRWYYGNGASTAAGDMGLRSSLGSQLEAMHAGISASPTVDLDSIERKMAGGVDAAARMRIIERALSPLTALYQTVLRMAFSEREMRPGVSHVVVVTSEARRATAIDLGRVAQETEVHQFVLKAEASVPWLAKAKVSAVLLTAAALEAYADERTVLGPWTKPRMQWEGRR